MHVCMYVCIITCGSVSDLDVVPPIVHVNRTGKEFVVMRYGSLVHKVVYIFITCRPDVVQESGCLQVCAYVCVYERMYVCRSL